jgi:hypothetical protein
MSGMIRITELVAEPNFSPREWQAPNPFSWNAAFGRHPVPDSADLQRVKALPRRPMPDADELAALVIFMTERLSNGRAAGDGCACAALGRECIVSLRPTQARVLYEVERAEGLLGPISVGHGKTLLDLLTPLVVPYCRQAVLLAPPALVSQMMREFDLLRQHFRIPYVQNHGGGGGSYPSDGPVLHVLPYSKLSHASSTVWLDEKQPDLIIADEVHCLRHATAVRTARVLCYFTHHPRTRFCGWSGSLTDSSVRDFAHIGALALKEGSPLPLDPKVVDEWSKALDPSDDASPAGALLEMCTPGESARAGFHRRLVDTLGVVPSAEPPTDLILEIDERFPPPVPEVVRLALDDLRAAWVRPDGEELVDAFSLNRCALQLACGFYYRWRFPDAPPVKLIIEWIAARKAWRQELRREVMKRRPHMDSPLLCSLAAARAWQGELGGEPYAGEEPCWRADNWPRWARAKHTIRYETETVRLDDFLARDAAEWALEHRGVVWYNKRAFGEWVSQLSGLPMHGGGPKASDLIAREDGSRSIIASVKAHGTGRDGLQRIFADQLMANPPSMATDWEQILGRLYRPGQSSPVVHASFFRHTAEMQKHVDTALSRAVYVEDVLGAHQKIRMGWRAAMHED